MTDTQPVKTGTATPWREIPHDGDGLLYLRDGHETGPRELLAEALRADGVVRSIHWAIKAAEEKTTLMRAFYGFVDYADQEAICDGSGVNALGDAVDRARPCVIALVDVSDD